MTFGRIIGAFLMGGAWLYIGSRKIARAKLEQNTPSISELRKYCQEQTEILSCSTCAFFNSEAAQQGQSWCDAPNPPDIEKNYCHTFTAKQDSPVTLPR
jgi:hypothetical protein